jgi:hypothetical protein
MGSEETTMMQLDLGFYLNLFPVDVPDNPVRVMTLDRSQYPDLRPLRKELQQSGQMVWVYADGDKVYGYGSHLDALQSKGFAETSICLQDTPRLTGRMILEGFIHKIKSEGYTPSLERKGRCEVFNWNEYRTTHNGGVRVYRGFDLRSIFLRDRSADKLVFGLVVDVMYAFQDQQGQSLSPYQIRQCFSNLILSEVRRIQGDLIPTGINTEVARQRLLEHILPFVRRFPDFRLPSDVAVHLHPEPVRVVLGSEIR